MFDFANSSFTTVMITAYFAVYFTEYVVGPDGTGLALWGTAIFASQFIVILTAPLLGALADFSGAKKRFLFVTYIGCAAGTILLGLAGPGDIVLAMALFVAANVCFSSGENIISAFLPEIAPSNMMGRISAIAWGLGYFGGIGALLVAVVILKTLGEGGYPWVWLMVGGWFLLAGIPTFLFVKERRQGETLPAGQTIWTVGFHRLARTLREIRRFKHLFRFLVTYMIYGSGVFAVITFAGIIAKDMLGLTDAQLGIYLIVLNVTAAIGAIAGGLIQDWIGSRPAILLALSGWLAALVIVMLIATPGEGQSPSTGTMVLFWIAGNLIGLSMGATFSASRALVGLLSPEDRSAEFYGLWGLFGKLGYMIGPATFGVLSDIESVGTRGAIAALGVFFIVGFVLMFTVNVAEGRAAARSDGGS